MAAPRRRKRPTSWPSGIVTATTTSDGAFLFLRFIQGAGNSFQNIGGYAVPPDPRQPLTTPRGFADPAKAAALLEREARRLEDEYDTMHVIWGDVIRLRRGLARSARQRPAGHARRHPHDQHRAVRERQGRRSTAATRSTRCIEFQKNGPPVGEALLGYGNWSRVGSKHVDDQLALASQKKMRPMLRSAPRLRKNLESRTTF